MVYASGWVPVGRKEKPVFTFRKVLSQSIGMCPSYEALPRIWFSRCALLYSYIAIFPVGAQAVVEL